MLILTVFIASLFLLNPVLPQTTEGANAPVVSYYQIQQGDTLWAIAQVYGYTVQEIRAANPGVDPRALSIGSVIALPLNQNDANSTTTAPVSYHTVQAGESLSMIAYQYGISIDELRAANPTLDPYTLQVGQQVQLPNGESVEAPATPPTALPAQVSTYTVQAGDTLSAIASRTGIPLATLLELNAPINPREIVVGQVILLSAPPPVAPASETVIANPAPSVITPLDGSLQSEAPSIAPLPESNAPIVPVDASIRELNIPQEVNIGGGNSDSDAAPSAAGDEPETAAPEEPFLAGNVMPITITVEEAIAVESAELSVNGTVLATFEDGQPYRYDLDTSRLVQGAYSLTLSITTTSGVVSTGSVTFEVLLPGATMAPTNLPDETPRDRVVTATQNLLAVSRQQVGLTAEQRVLHIDGQQIPFNFMFSVRDGLVPVQPAVVGPQPTSLNDILSRPFNVIPAPIREALAAQNPEFWSWVTLVLTVMLLPQGLFTLYWMLYTWNNPRIAEQYRAPKEFVDPQISFTAILPARHEEGVIQDTIRGLDRIEYPEHLKEVLVMIRDEDDDETIRRAQEVIWEIGKPNIRLITFTDGPKNKPNGLNRGLKEATKDVVCVFDAEDEPHPELYQVINTVMVRDNADVVQAGVQLMNFKSNWFSALNCLEYFFWFKSGLHCFTRKLNVTPLGGNTVFFKRYWLERINGWDEKSLTEDADVGIRLTLQGAKMQIVYDEKHATREETPHNVDSFIKQRTRWCQGFYEIFAKGDWRKLPTMKQKITALYILLNSLMQAAMIIYLPIGLYIGLTQKLPIVISMISYMPLFLMVLQLFINLVGIREFTAAYGMRLPLGYRIKMAFYYYPYQIMLSVSAFRALGRFLTRKNAWEKTAHSNLHRQTQAQAQTV